MSRNRRAGWAALFWAAFLFAASVMPMPPQVIVPGWSLDKVYHGLFYLPLGALIFSAWPDAHRRPLVLLLLSGLLAGAYGLGLEGVQSFLPWRSFDWLDAAMDLLGGTAGAAGVVVVRIYFNWTGAAPPA